LLWVILDYISLVDFAATEFNEIFPGRQQRQYVMRRFRDGLRPHLQGVRDGLVESKLTTWCPTAQESHSILRPGRTEIYTTQSKTLIYQFWFYQAISNTLKMRKDTVPETSEDFNTLTWLSAPEHFTEFCRRETFKTYINKTVAGIYRSHKLKYTSVSIYTRIRSATTAGMQLGKSSLIKAICCICPINSVLFRHVSCLRTIHHDITNSCFSYEVFKVL
jgi:hypothetical protein